VFYDLVEQDELLSPLFGGRVDDEHRRRATLWWSEVMGGPAEYTEQLGGYERMLGRHLGLGIAPEQRLRRSSVARMQGQRRQCREHDQPRRCARFAG
jgi:hemoglobin